MPGLNLTRTEAEARSKIISDVHYQVFIDFTLDAQTFESISTITFKADLKVANSTFLDLVANEVYKITLNNQEIPLSEYQDYRIPLNNLQENNELTVRAKMDYSHQGEGLHRFKDPADEEVYLYSQYEVPDARRVFADFEQPDIKATFDFTVVAPSSWEVISTEAPKNIEDASWVPENFTEKIGLSENHKGETAKQWTFNTTPKISTYVTSICAGPYGKVEDELTNTDGRIIPLRIFARQSLIPFLDNKVIFDITKKGFDFYGKEFNYPYPYSKYDNVFCPEYNIGAMENVGNVTFTDEYIFRSATPQPRYERRCMTILHELAHMWFGDLVTMKWWNDLWLNESFADFMATFATAEATEYTDNWVTYNINEKTWAFDQDALPSTHPVAADIKDLQDVEVNFDGITYAKGGSILKQLVYYVGRKNFMEGIHNYLTKYKYDNATLQDLLNELEKTSDKDLKTWTKLWIETAGPNTLIPEIEVTDNQLTKLNVIQTAPKDHPTLRPHAIGIGLYRENDAHKFKRVAYFEASVLPQEKSAINLPAEISKIPFDGKTLLLLNDEDWTYGHIQLDPVSREIALNNLENFTYDLTRGLILTTFFDEVINTSLKIKDYFDFLFRVLQTETNPSIIRNSLENIVLIASRWTPENQRFEIFSYAGDQVYSLAQKTLDPNIKLQYTQAFLLLATTDKHADIVEKTQNRDLANGGIDVELDIEMKWNLLSALVNIQKAGVKEIEEFLKQDETILGRETAAKLVAQIPTFENKNYIFDKLTTREDLTNGEVRKTTMGYQVTRTPETSFYDEKSNQCLVQKYYDILPTIWSTRQWQNSETLTKGLYPRNLVSQASIDFGKKFLSENQDKLPGLLRMIKENVYITEEALKIQEYNSN